MAKKKLTKDDEYYVSGSWFYRFIKRCFDIFVSFLFLVLFSWLIIILLLIKFFEDFHNPVYVSKRVGKDGHLFNFHKIRSMVVDAEKMKAKMIRKGMNEADGPVFKMKDDPRITPFGKFLRKTSFILKTGPSASFIPFLIIFAFIFSALTTIDLILWKLKILPSFPTRLEM